MLVYETFNPGALYRVTAFKLDGEEVELWKGTGPDHAGPGHGRVGNPGQGDFKTNRVKLYIDSKNVPGWNEIDAVGLRDKDKKMHVGGRRGGQQHLRAAVSDTPAGAATAVNYENRIRHLEDEVKDLKEVVKELKRQVNKDK